MGQTIESLSRREISDRTIFNNRFVIELAENVHIHYRNLRIILGLEDFKKIGNGCSNAFQRWRSLGNPIPDKNKHIELARHSLSDSSYNAGIQINLNKNLYKLNTGKIFAEGAGIDEDEYIHVKMHNLRLELTKKDFCTFADAIAEAHGKLLKQGGV